MATAEPHPLPSKLDGFNRSQPAGTQPASSRMTTAQLGLQRSKDNSQRPEQAEAEDQPAAAPMPQAQMAHAVAAAHHDPRALAAEEADKLLHTGAMLGTATWAIWVILTIALVISPPPLVLIPALILNLMLVSPKFVYKMTTWILLLVPVVDVAVEAVKESGVDKVDIRIAGWQKGGIYIIDLAILFVVIMYITVVMTSICYIAKGAVTDVALKTTSFVTGDNTYASISTFCSQLTK